MSKIINIRGAAYDPNVVLNKAINEFDSVVLIGWDVDGHLDARASLNLDQANINWLIDVFKAKLLAGHYNPEDVELS